MPDDRRPSDGEAAPSDEALDAAAEARLRWVSDAEPGIIRERHGGGFRYLRPDRRIVTASGELARIKHIAVPPAWRDVWICPRGDGHIQATGRDARGRKQYRYHERWREVRDAVKYSRLPALGRALPRIRARVAGELGRTGLPRDKVLAAVVRLLDLTLVRVGNEDYARDNHSYGLTTLRTRHLDVRGDRMRFRFRGKSGVEQDVALTDRRLARVVRSSQELPGQALFQYLDDEGERHGVSSDDVNAYLAAAAGDEEFTAKDFRTWTGTMLVARELRRLGTTTTERGRRRIVVEAIAAAARRLGNTPSVCRRSYVHPDVIAAHADGRLLDPSTASRRLRAGLSADEAALLLLLRRSGTED